MEKITSRMKKFIEFVDEGWEWPWSKKDKSPDDIKPEPETASVDKKPYEPYKRNFNYEFTPPPPPPPPVDYELYDIKPDDLVKVLDWDGLTLKQKDFLLTKPHFKVNDVVIKNDEPYVEIGYNIPFKMSRFEICDLNDYKHKILFLQFNIAINLHGENDEGNFFRGKTNMSQLFPELFAEKMPDAYINFAGYDDIYKTKNGYYIDNVDLKNYDFVFFGFMSNYSSMARLIISYLERNDVPYLKYETYKDFDNKAYEFDLVEKLGYPYIPSILATKLNSRIMKEVSEFGYPLIVKDVVMARGEGVWKIKDADELRNKFARNTNRLMLIQKMIPNDGDFRVIVIKGKKVLIIKRKRIDTKEFRSNVALGGKAVRAELPDEVVAMCEDIAQHVFCDIVGFDILQDLETGEYFVMETNASPHFPTFSVVSGINMPMFITDYIIREIKKNEKSDIVKEGKINKIIDVIDWYENLPDKKRTELQDEFGNWEIPSRETKFYSWLKKMKKYEN